MFIDYLYNKMNVIIILLYIIIIYSYDFRDKLEYLIILTGIIILIIYKKNKGGCTIETMEGNDGTTTTSGNTILDLFNEIDTNNDKVLSDNEIEVALVGLGLDLTPGEIDSTIRDMKKAAAFIANKDPNVERDLNNSPINFEAFFKWKDEDNTEISNRMRTRSLIDMNELINRVKILEEVLTTKKWSAAQSYEITSLRNKLDGMRLSDQEKESTTLTLTIPTLTPVPLTVEPLSKNNPIKPMGMFDGLCIPEKSKDYNLVNEDQLNTYLGSTIPLKTVKTTGGLEGPSIDGTGKTPQKLSIFGNNQSSISCCDESPFFTSTGCICITKEQEKYIGSRGGNHIFPEKEQCLL